ncbi:MAG TPA: PAC2 family protein [Acidimicrobiales bacterium]
MASLDHVHWHRRQPLRSPMLVAAFEGWNDAGDAASTAVRHLRDVWELDLVAELDSEEFYSFTDTRPHVTFDDDGLRRIDWPANRFWAGEVPGQDRDLLVLDGIEPNLRWRTYGEQITAVAHELGVSMVVTLGALLTDIPHTRPTSVIGTADDAELITRLDLRPSGYEGPTGIVGALHEACRTAGLDSISLWGSVPSYVPGSTAPKAALALIERLGQLLDTTIPVTELEIATTAYERQLDELVQEDEESSTYVAELERVFDEQALHGNGSDLVDEVERFLRDR